MSKLSLYYSPWCPFCIRVTHALKHRLKSKQLGVELRDTGKPKYREQLIKGGGKQQVPCLKIETDANVRWQYESDDILQYLDSLPANT